MIINIAHYTEGSLCEDIATISRENHPIRTVQLINIISKYILSFVEGVSTRECLPYGAYREQMRHMLDILSKPSFVECTIHEVKYQLEMILDIPSTVEIMRDIIENVENSMKDNSAFYGLDLGSGSGILMLAQYIGAKRAGIPHIHITGIEQNYSAQGLSDQLIRCLSLGDVRRGDSLDPKSYPITAPNFVSNENLSTRGIPFSFCDVKTGKMPYEPFLENLEVLEKIYGKEFFRNAEFFPRGLQTGTILDQTPGQKYLANEMFGLERIKMQCRGYNVSECTYPLQIKTGDTWRNLDEIGDSERMQSIFEPTGYRRYRRWLYTSPQYLETYYRNHRKARRIGIFSNPYEYNS